MQISGISEDQFVDKIVDRLIEKVLPELKKQTEEQEKKDKTLTKKDVYTDYIPCSPNTFNDFYLAQTDLPRMRKGSRIVFSEKAIIEWKEKYGKEYKI